MVSASLRELMHALGRQQRVVHALVMRDVRSRYGRYYLGYLWAFISPILRVAILVVIHALLFASNEIYGVSPALFFFLGVWPFFLFIRAFVTSIGSFAGGRSLFVYRTVRPIDAWLSAVITELGIYLIILGLCIVGAAWWGMDVEIDRPLEMIFWIFMVFTLGASLGLFIETVNAEVPDVGRIARIARRVMFWASGVFYTIEMLPPQLKPFLIWNPVLHALDLIRGAALLEYEPEGSPMYVCLWVIGSTALALAYYRQRRFRVVSA